MEKITSKTAIITGASSGFGAATAEHLASLGISISLGARRLDRLEELQKKIQDQSDVKVFCHELDVQSSDSVANFVNATQKHFGNIDYLINNAGFGHTLDFIETSKEEDWEKIWNTNVMGVVRMTQKVLPLMKTNAGSRIINIGSTAGYEAYEGGGSYCSSKFALRAVTQGLRYELMEKGIGVSSVDPGMAETEFSIVRFDGDQQKAKKVYDGFQPLVAKDIAEIVGFIVTRPAHVSIDQLLVMPQAQAPGRRILRRS